LAKQFIKDGNPDKALKLIAELRELGENSTTVDLIQGVALSKKGLFNQAEPLLVQAAQKSPKDPEAQNALCILFSDMKKYDEAKQHCHQAVQLDDQYAEAWNNYGYLILTAFDDPTGAIDALKRAVQIDSTNIRFLNNLGFSEVSAGNIDAGQQIFQSIFRKSDALYNTGLALERAGQYENAIHFYQMALEESALHTQARDALDRIHEDPLSNFQESTQEPL
jgi:Flp pilus assembly protein TadD